MSRDLDRDGVEIVPAVLADGIRRTATDALEAIFGSESDVAAERGWTTDVYRVAYALPAKHPTFVELCTHPPLLETARRVLGADCVLAGFNGLDLHPGGPAQSLHRDHPVPTPGVTLYLHVVCALDDFTVESGATRAVLGSHRDLLPVPTPERREVTSLPVSAGDGIAFDGALLHAAGVNRSGGPRRALHVFFARPWVQPHWDFPSTLPPEVASSLDAEQRQVLGWGPGPRRFDLHERRVRR